MPIRSTLSEHYVNVVREHRVPFPGGMVSSLKQDRGAVIFILKKK